MRTVHLSVLGLLATTALITGCSTDGAPHAMSAGSAVNANIVHPGLSGSCIAS